MPDSTVEILLPTYNGSRFLAQQLDSLCRQSFTDFTVLTYDDGSKDNSIEIVHRYEGRISITRIPNPENKNLGAVKSFELLIRQSTADTVLFSDQDDIWNERKVEKCVAAVKAAASETGSQPVAAFSDLSLFSDNPENAQGSFLASTGFNPAALNDPYYLSFRNPAPGCAMAVNRALIEEALPFDDSALMHDWWLMLTASLRGKVVFIDESLVNYRLHSGNTLGITPDKPMRPFFSILSMLNPEKPLAILSRSARNNSQAKAIFRKCDRHFSTILFWSKFIAGRYLFPVPSKHIRKLQQYSWKR